MGQIRLEEIVEQRFPIRSIPPLQFLAQLNVPSGEFGFAIGTDAVAVRIVLHIDETEQAEVIGSVANDR